MTFTEEQYQILSETYDIEITNGNLKIQTENVGSSYYKSN